MRRAIDLFFIVLLLAWFFLPSICKAEERTFIVTETELMLLDEKYKTAESSMMNAQNELNQVKLQLSESKKGLSLANQQLIEARAISKMESERLEKAEKLLNEYIAEQKKKTRRIKWQRNIAYGIAIGLLVGYVKERESD